MLRLVYSDRTERLLDALLEVLRRGTRDPVEPVEIVVPNANVEAFVRFGVAQALGVAANLRFRRLERFAARFVSEAASGAFRLVDQERTEGALLHVLHAETPSFGRDLERVSSYLEGPGGDEGRDLRRAQLASHLGHLFEEYAYHRPGMLAAWRGGTLRDPDDSDERWQAALWRRILGDGGLLRVHGPEAGVEWILLAELLERHSRVLPSHDRPLHVFGLSYVARVYQQLFGLLRERRPVHVYSLNPCLEFWEDVESPRELRNRLRRHRGELRVPPERLREEDPYELLKMDPDDTPALRLWGLPGRENHRLLNQLADCDYEGRFSDPDRPAGSLLEAIQLDVLRREPRRRAPPDEPPWPHSDDSLRIVGCPSVRREVETVADEIWRLVRGSGDGARPLRFSDVAVVVNHPARDVYLPHVEAAFQELHRIPMSVGDLPLASHHRTVEAARLLFELPFGRFGRREVLAFLNHPAVTAPFEDLAPEEWPLLAEELGIFFGADASDLAETYLPPEIGHWDQGLRRLALGAFLAGEASGDERLFEGPDGEALAADPGARAMEPRARFGLLARGLLADAEIVRSRMLPLSTWATFLRRQLETYLGGTDDGGALLACLRSLGRLEEMDVAGTPVSGRTATSLAIASLSRLEGRRGHHLAEGVVVSSFLPMRTVPFRAIFVLGLGEGKFPAPTRRDALDLRARRRRPGDVTPAERDRYMFLETLLSARESLRLSWVDRDLTSGESLLPSSVVQQLSQILEEGYVGRSVSESRPLRRYDLRYFPKLGEADGRPVSAPLSTVSAEAFEEARVRTLGTPWREDASAVPLLESLPDRDEPEAGLLREALRLRPVPSRETLVDDGPLELSLRNLRKFLESPLQAWGRVVAGLAEVDEDLPEAEEDEPIRISSLLGATIPRDSFLTAMRTGVEPVELLESSLRRRELAGEIPPGLLGSLERERLREILDRWQTLRDRSLAGVVPVQARMGRGPEWDDFDELLPALELDLELPGGPRNLHLHGRLLPLTEDFRATLMPRESSPEKLDPNDPRSRRARWGLHALFEHFVLAAAGVVHDRPRELRLLLARPEANRGLLDPKLLRLSFEPVSRADALETLRRLATDLLTGAHDYLLPCEAILGMSMRELGNGDAIVGRIERRVRWGRDEWSCRWGVIPEPESFPVPSPSEASRMAERRFRPLFERLGSWEELS